jgi:hypothetical protein
VTVELALYSLNFDLYTLAQCNFEFMATGQTQSKMILNSFDVEGYHEGQMLASIVFFVLFTIFFCSRFISDVWTLHYGPGVRLFEGQDCKSKCYNFIGIDHKHLVSRSFLVQCVAVIIMVLRKMVRNCV